MAEDYSKGRDTELILAPGTFVFVLDETKGKVNTYCGPYKTSLSNTDRLVAFDRKSKRYTPCSNQQQAIQTNISASKGEYVILENPARDNKQPEVGKLEDLSLTTLRTGQKENLPGPVTFALWPSQDATIVQGHHLRTNQYLTVRVYDDEAARENWEKSVIRTAASSTVVGEADSKKSDKKSEEKEFKKGLKIDKEDLRTGQLLVIRGTDVAFYIPPTGIEVLKDENGEYVRNAVTLERMEYSILLDEDGNKEYVIGPSVVFPLPTQQFKTFGKDPSRKFRAFELQPTTGLHVKVIADYTENGKSYKIGQELFITGEDQAVYYPRTEHSIVQYNGGDKHFATAIPAGEGRYVLGRQTGDITLVKGPAMFLPNPIHEVMVRRLLSEKECALYYPGNAEVVEVNRVMREEFKGQPKTKSGIPILPTSANLSLGEPDLAGISFGGAPGASVNYMYADSMVAAPMETAGNPKGGDSIQRSANYKPPRTITLDTKYQGGVRIDVWSGYAVQVVNSKGQRRVVVGPQILLLEYDEKLVPLTLSTGKPKNSDNRKDTAYLKHFSNPVSDVVAAKTADMVDIDIQVKYLVRFEETEKDNWFSVDNYIQYMVDHLRSVIGNSVRRMSIKDFYENSADTVRDIVLGEKTEGKRPLKHFAENGMTVYDLEVISVQIKDNKIADLLVSSRKDALADSISLERQLQKLEVIRTAEDAKRKSLTEVSQTTVLGDKLERERLERIFEMDARKERAEIDSQERKAEIEDIILETAKKEQLEKEAAAESELVRAMREMLADAESTKVKMESIQPALIEALSAAANAGILEKVAPTLGALAFVNGSDLEKTLTTMLKGTGAESVLENLKNVGKRPSKMLTTQVQ